METVMRPLSARPGLRLSVSSHGHRLHHTSWVQRAKEAVRAAPREAVAEVALTRPRRREAARTADHGHVMLVRADEAPGEGGSERERDALVAIPKLAHGRPPHLRDGTARRAGQRHRERRR